MNDLWIAAVAHQHKPQVISRDPHFDHIARITRTGW